jgi:GntR family transcriptional regulator, transcriptional repressor for pyruvate dehydrogenase complex
MLRSPLGNEAVMRPLKISETVARDIVHDIVTRGLTTGDRLPSESVMLEDYGVSRESMREGLRLLEVQGLISLRRGPGGGPVVERVDPANLGRVSTLYYHLAGGTYAELFEAWLVSEPMLAERAARHSDRELVREAMAPFIDTMHGNTDDVAEFVRMHTDFHAIVARLANNRVLELTLEAIGSIVTHHVVVRADPRDVEEELEHGHAQIARAISAGQATKARRLMEAHIQHLVDYYSDEIGEQMNDFIEWQ